MLEELFSECNQKGRLIESNGWLGVYIARFGRSGLVRRSTGCPDLPTLRSHCLQYIPAYTTIVLSGPWMEDKATSVRTGGSWPACV